MRVILYLIIIPLLYACTMNGKNKVSKAMEEMGYDISVQQSQITGELPSTIKNSSIQLFAKEGDTVTVIVNEYIDNDKSVYPEANNYTMSLHNQYDGGTWAGTVGKYTVFVASEKEKGRGELEEIGKSIITALE